MNKFNLVIFTAVSFIFSVCAGMAMGQKPASGPAWQVLVRANHSTVYEPKNLVIKSQNELDALWEESQNGIAFGPAKPKVDFSRKWVIVSFLGMVRSSGHTLEIQSIRPGSKATTITLIHKAPGANCVSAQVIENPFLVSAVDHYAPDRTEFRVIKQDMPCE